MTTPRTRWIISAVMVTLLTMAAILCVKYSHHPVHPDPAPMPLTITQTVQAPVDTPKVSHYVAPKPAPKKAKAVKHHKAAHKATIQEDSTKWNCHTMGNKICGPGAG